MNDVNRAAAPAGQSIANEHAVVAVVLKAAMRAAQWHAGQRRKGAAAEPYLNHLLEVAHLVAAATGGNDMNIVVASLLHDAVEDQGISGSTIAEEFGDDVAALVLEVTDDKALPKDARKRLQVDHASQKSPRAALLKLADNTSNLAAIATSPPSDWPVQRRLDYVAWARQIVAGLQVENSWLQARFRAAADVAERAALQT